VVVITGTPTGAVSIAFTGGVSGGSFIGITGLGKISSDAGTSPLAYNDGLPHAVTLQVTASAADLWVDGVKVVTSAGVVNTWTMANFGTGDVIGQATYILSRFGIGASVADARVVAHHSALLADCRPPGSPG
jgi:hypothetical protein